MKQHIKQHSRKAVGIIIAFLVVIGTGLCIILASATHPTAQESMKTTQSGISYQILKSAPDAPKAIKGHQVFVQYTGWLSENGQPGKKFDSSYDRDEPFVFVLGKGQVIKGWDESVADMHIGEKRRVIIPPELAYGNRSIGNIIPANSTLIFDIELLK
ncbi:MAG: FKBP-type peptidyl-prolyl cis-trans isomerase [Verrucomicrobia bacterium]|nr:FKBP-type peptidyl-prolyl cis-trans isomerase [Verrucomicrobiota bacterium]MBS0638199.1 FKBP-type peptidyl-prolyl cis-trans isomerase [Verrucomicrobiota bacterium]